MIGPWLETKYKLCSDNLVSSSYVPIGVVVNRVSCLSCIRKPGHFYLLKSI